MHAKFYMVSTCRYLPLDLSQWNSYWKKNYILIYKFIYIVCNKKFFKSSSCFVHGRKKLSFNIHQWQRIDKVPIPYLSFPWGKALEETKFTRIWGITRALYTSKIWKEIIFFWKQFLRTIFWIDDLNVAKCFSNPV